MTALITGMTACNSPYEVVALANDVFPNNDAIHIPINSCSSYSSKPLTFTYGELIQRIDLVSAAWEESLVKGPVALILENRVDFFIHWLGLNKLGICVVPISAELQDEEIRYQLEHSNVRTLLCLEEHLERLSLMSAKLVAPVSCLSTDTLTPSDASVVKEPKLVGLDDECAILYTSGSTGKPKGCILSNEYFIQQGVWYASQGGYMNLRQGRERLLTPLPLTHMNAMAVSSMAMFMTGGCLIQIDRFHPSSWWDTVRVSQATALHYLGVLPAMLLSMPADARDNFSGQVRFGFGAGVNPIHHAPFEDRFGFPLVEAWAMTETGAGGVIAANEEPRHVGACCFGRPTALVEWDIVDEFGCAVPAGVAGELRVRSASADASKGFFTGYLNDVEATKEVWRDGWLNTGDVVRADLAGSLYFVDRLKNIIRRSGENISAVEVESIIADHSLVRLAVAIAVPDEIRGEEVAVCVVLEQQEAACLNAAQLIYHFAAAKLAYYKTPGWLIFKDVLPVTASQKPMRSRIKQIANSAVTSGHAFDLREWKSKRQR